MKLRNMAWLLLAISSLLITSPTFAMIGGVDNPAVQTAFEEALKTGTKEAITQCMQNYNITWNTRCIHYRLLPRGTDYLEAYPLEYAIKYYGSASEAAFEKRIQLLLDLDAPMNEYKDYHPLIHIAPFEDKKISILLRLGADPHKQVMNNKQLETPLEYVTKRIKNSSSHKIYYQNMLGLLSHPPVVEKNMPQAPASIPSAPARPVSPTFLKLMEEATARPADTATDTAKHNKNTVYTRQQVAVIAAIAFLAGVLCAKLVEWHVNRAEDTPDNPHTEIDQEANQYITEQKQ